MISSMNIINIDSIDYENKYNIHSLLAKLLKVSNFDDENIKELLKEDYTLSICEADCVIQASDRIKKAKDNNEKVYVVGDYDADGICATAIMSILLNKLDINNEYYIPDRFLDGYGINEDIVDKAYESGSSLIITVDNGVRALEAIEKAKKLNLDIIITDHHTIIDDLKDILLVHPSIMGEEYKYLCGAGVAYEISRYLIGDDNKSTVLACVASIGDIMVLSKETRNIVKAGLAILNNKYPSSIYRLNDSEKVNSDSIGFHIVPKINSVGRLADRANANVVVDYLISDDEMIIDDISFHINELNEERKSITNKQEDEAKKMIKDDPFIIIHDANFHEGINGIVAGRLIDLYKKPALVMSERDDYIKGSARSLPGINLINLFQDNEYIDRFGGHAMACGVVVKKENFDCFYGQVQKDMANYKVNEEAEENIIIELKPEDMGINNIFELDRIEPIPQAIRAINFALNTKYINRIFDNEKIIRLIIDDNLEAIIFKNSKFYKKNNSLNLENSNYLIGRLSINEFRGNYKSQFIVDDIA